ncbi:MAG: inner membrane protein [Thermoplasmata archaeon]|jgi:membrane protein implicated in regulation of membrane protease activity|nr:inner membrane protein [Thermoplasmata archaeon]
MVDATLVGYGLVSLGVVMFILEALVPGFFLAVPATILVILGAFALLAPDFNLFAQYAPFVAIVAGVPATAVTIYLYRRLAPPTHGPTTRSGDSMVGLEGLVTVPVTHDAPRGKVKIHQETWSAITRGPDIAPKTRVRVAAVEGIILVVEPVHHA